MRVQFRLHFFSKRRALFLFGFLQSMPRAVLSRLLILRHAGEGFAGFSEFYDVVFAHA